MLQLAVFTQQTDNAPFGATATKAQYLDLKGKETIALNFQVSDVTDITSRRGDFSQTFKLPFSNTNDTFFTYAFNVNLSTGVFDPTKKTKAVILVDSIPQIHGYLQLKNIYKKARLYEVVLFGEVADLANELKDSKLKDAFLDSADPEEYITTYNHYLLTDEIINSFTGVLNNTAGVDQPSILYPIIDYATNTDVDENVISIYGSGGTSGIFGSIYKEAVRLTTLRPAMKIKEIIDVIFTKAGYRYTSTFFSSAYFGKLFMLLATDAENIITKHPGGFKAGIGADLVFNVANVMQIESFLITDDTSTGFYDLNNVVNTTTGGFAPVDSHTYKLRMTLNVTATTTDGQPSSGEVWVKLHLGGVGGQIVGSTVVNINNIASGSTTTYSQDFLCFTWLGVETMFTVQFVPTSLLGNAFTAFKINQSGTSLEMVSILNLTQDGKEVLIPDCMPDVQQIDFLKAIIQRFNLIIEPDKNDANHLYIEPFNDWLDDGATVDWTSKLNTEKEIKQSFTNEIQKKEFNFTDAEDEDLLNSTYINSFSKVFGAYKDTNTNEFSTGELTLDEFFSPFLISPLTSQDGTLVTNQDFLIARHFKLNDDGVAEPTSTKPKLFFYSGTPQTLNTNYNIAGLKADGNNEITNTNKYPLCSQYESAPVTASTKTLAYQSDTPYSYGLPLVGTTYTDNNVYNVYWSRFINELYSNEARILECELFLNSLDIHNLRYNQQIFIKDAYYRIDSIKGYVPGANKSTKVKLLKIVTKIAAETSGGLIADDFNTNGIIDFIDGATGAGATVTAMECTNLGYFWDTTTNTCLWNSGLGLPKPQPTNFTHKSAGIASGSSKNNAKGGNNGLVTTFKNTIATNIKNIQVATSTDNLPKTTTSIYNIVYYLYSYDNVAVEKEAYVNGDDKNAVKIEVPTESYIDVRVDALSVLKSTATAPAAAVKGSTERTTYYGAVKTPNGVGTRIGARLVEDTNTTVADTDAGARVVDMDCSAAREISFTCKSYHTDAYTDFVLKVELTIMPLDTVKLGGFNALYQNGDSITFQDGNTLEFN